MGVGWGFSGVTGLVWQLESPTLGPDPALCHNYLPRPGSGESSRSAEAEPGPGACRCEVSGSTGELREGTLGLRCSLATSGDASERQPLKFPIRGLVRWKAGPGSEVVGVRLSAPLILLPVAGLGLGWTRAARWGLSLRSRPTQVCSGEGARIPRFPPLLLAPRPGCAPGLDGVKVSASISTIFPWGHVNKYARI